MLLSRVFFAIAVVVAAVAFSASAAYAQIVNPAYRPPETDDMPAWARLLYMDDDQINAFQVDAAVEAYYRSRDAGEEELESGESEEHEDVYLWYYRLWRKSVELYIQADGSIVIPSADAARAAQPVVGKRERVLSSNSWSLVGPTEVYRYREQEVDSLQPPRPWQANVYSVEVAPSNGDILYCGTETGAIFKSTDKGLNWVQVSNNYNLGLGVTALAIHPTDPNIAYATAGAHYLYKTVDGGTTWSTSLTVTLLSCESIKIHPDNPNIVFAAGGMGVYRSTNAGVTWTQVTESSILKRRPVWDLAINPVAGRRNEVYIVRRGTSATLCEFWKSTDYGATFSVQTTGWVSGVTGDLGARLAVTPADADRIYAVVLTKEGPRLMKSTDAGENWSTVAIGETSAFGMNNGQGYYDLAILASPLDENSLLVGTTSAYQSTDGGTTFTSVGGYVGPFPIHADIQGMAAHGGDTWIATDGGVTYSTDFFTSVTNATTRSKGISASEYWGFGQGWNEDITVGGRYHNGNGVMSEHYGSGTLLRVGGAEDEAGFVLHGRSGHAIFNYTATPFEGVIVPNSIDQPLLPRRFVFTKFPTEGRFPQDDRDFEIQPLCYMRYWMAKDSTIWESENGGKAWKVVKNFGTNVYKIELSRSNPSVAYVAAQSGVWKTVDGGTTWSNLVLPTGIRISPLFISLSYSNANELWISPRFGAGTEKVFKTSDGGTTWENMTTDAMGSTSQSPASIVYQGGTNGGVYIALYPPSTGGIEEGAKVLYRNNDMPEWVDCSRGLPKGFYALKMLPFYRDGKLRIAGTQGIYEMPFYEDSKPIAQITVDKTRTSCPRDTFYFDDYSVLKHAGATWQWSFPGAAYISSTTVRNPKVVYNTPGSYSVSLTVTQGSTSSSQTLNNFIVIEQGNSCTVDTVAGNALVLASGKDFAVQQKALGITTNTLTISMWLKPDSIQLWRPTHAALGLIMSGSTQKNGLYWRENNQLGYVWNGTNRLWSGGPVVPADEWSHIAFVVTPTSATIYLNGTGFTHVTALAPATIDEPFYIGRDSYNTLRNAMNGSIDEVCFYNRALSQNEIRELMYLTKNNPNAGSKPAVDTSLIAYYQFNEPDGTAYDKVGTNDISLASFKESPFRVPSDAPVGGGTSSTISVFSNGLYTFGTTGLRLIFRFGGVYPAGDVVVSRLNNPPTIEPEPVPLSNGYWIVRNYGANSAISPLGRVQMSNLAEVDTAMVGTPSSVLLYQRPANATGATWSVPLDKADIVTTSGNVIFMGIVTTGVQVGDFGQFAVAACIAPTNLSAPVIGTTTAVVTWSAAAGAVSYKLLYKAVTASTWTAIDSITATQYTVQNLARSTQYEWLVRTNSVYTNSPYSTVSTFTTATYCIAAGSVTSYEYIDRVRIMGALLDNISGDDGGYGDYTGSSATLEQGGSYTVELTPGYPRGIAYAEGWQVWIDYNHDDDFDDAGEQAGQVASLTTASITFTVPTDAVLGATRMRVSMRYFSYTTPCDTTLTEGEVEDYTIVLSSGSTMRVAVSAAEPQMSIPPAILKVYPNPVDDVLHVEIDESVMSAALSLQVIDGLGRVVYSLPQVSSHTLEIPMRGLARGAYHVVLRDGGRQYKVHEVVKVEGVR